MSFRPTMDYVSTVPGNYGFEKTFKGDFLSDYISRVTTQTTEACDDSQSLENEATTTRSSHPDEGSASDGQRHGKTTADSSAFTVHAVLEGSTTAVPDRFSANGSQTSQREASACNRTLTNHSDVVDRPPDLRDPCEYLQSQHAANAVAIMELQRRSAHSGNSDCETTNRLYRCVEQFQRCLSALVAALRQQPLNTEGILTLLVQQQRIGKLSEYVVQHANSPRQAATPTSDSAVRSRSSPPRSAQCVLSTPRESEMSDPVKRCCESETSTNPYYGEAGDFSDYQYQSEGEDIKKEGGKFSRKALVRRPRNPKPYLANTTHSCTMCKSNITPQWRYLEGKRFCNACYMRIKRHLATKGIMVSGQKAEARRRRSGEPLTDITGDWLDPVLDEVNKLRIVEEEVRKVRLGMSVSEDAGVEDDNLPTGVEFGSSGTRFSSDHPSSDLSSVAGQSQALRESAANQRNSGAHAPPTPELRGSASSDARSSPTEFRVSCTPDLRGTAVSGPLISPSTESLDLKRRRKVPSHEERGEGASFHVLPKFSSAFFSSAAPDALEE